jgi:uncharacterized protein GlcG (DUF336 family)
MRIHVLMALTLAAGLLGGAAARAEPAPPPSATAASAPAPDYGLALNNEQVRAVANAAFDEARRGNWRMAVAIVGPDGELLYFEKLDGTQNASAALAQRKARTSALFRRPTKAFADQFSAGNTGFMTFPDDARPIASEGGIPIIVGGHIVGAIGVSGGTGQQDGVVATAGANAVR